MCYKYIACIAYNEYNLLVRVRQLTSQQHQNLNQRHRIFKRVLRKQNAVAITFFHSNRFLVNFLKYAVHVGKLNGG